MNSHDVFTSQVFETCLSASSSTAALRRFTPQGKPVDSSDYILLNLNSQFMKFTLKPSDPGKLEADVLIQYCFENEINVLSNLPANLLVEIKKIAAREDFIGKEAQTLSFYTHGLIAAYKLLLQGQGKKEEFDLFKLYNSVALSIKHAVEGKPAKIAIVMDEYWLKKYPVEQVIKSVLESVKLSSYRFIKYKGEEEQKKIRNIEEVAIIVSANKISRGAEGVVLGDIFSDATIFARDLINEPPEVTDPSFLAKTAKDIEKETKGLVKVKIFEKEEIAKLGMNSFLGVAQGSVKPPKFIRLSYKPSGASQKVVLIGKGITFDTGGLSLKGSEHMETMKLDMAGAATVLAVFKALPKLSVKVEVVGLIAACENMPGGSALKPGDILQALNGKTIEVLNTDAEGRLTLADALSYANTLEKADEIIDLATLTGACAVALGQDIAGLFSNNDKLRVAIEKSALASGEKIWHMPLEKEYKELNKSHIADIKNIQTGRYGGAITAALFLAEFAGATPWVHLDIAGPAYAEKDTALVPQGGSGFGVRTLLHYLLNK